MSLLVPSILAVAFFAIMLMLYKERKSNRGAVAGNGKQEVEEVAGRSMKFKRGFKLISYKEALEASKQFILDITRLVLQKFTPSDKNSLLEAGRKLFKCGVQYLHVVDVLSLSLQKQSEVGGPKKIVKKERSSGTGK